MARDDFRFVNSEDDAIKAIKTLKAKVDDAAAAVSVAKAKVDEIEDAKEIVGANYDRTLQLIADCKTVIEQYGALVEEYEKFIKALAEADTNMKK